jgi:hypothetical protein
MGQEGKQDHFLEELFYGITGGVAIVPATCRVSVEFRGYAEDDDDDDDDASSTFGLGFQHFYMYTQPLFYVLFF